MEMKSLSYKKLGNTGLGMVFKSVMVVIMLSVVSFTASGQDMIIRSFEAMPFDVSASMHKRYDLNNQPCALVKVLLAATGATFEGNVIGNVEYNVSEYWVYMSKGTKRIRIKCPNYLPIMVEFSGYGVNGLESNTTYELVVALPVYSVSPVPAVSQEQPISNPVQQDVMPIQQGESPVQHEDTSVLPTENPVQQVENQQNFIPEKFEVNGVTFEMVKVPGGTFTMGATAEQGSDALDDEKPTHSVTLSGYYIGKYEVTQAQWKAIMGNNPSEFKGDNLPVDNVSWNDCQEFIRKLNQLTGKKFSLPTEAQWEYAARGGKSGGTKYSGSKKIKNVAWYNGNSGSNMHALKLLMSVAMNGYAGNSGSKTHPVGTKSPNDLGIYDMTGNVLEWCQDYWGHYTSASQTNPTGPESGSDRMFRGGSWNNDAGFCRVSFRGSDTPDGRGNYLGFRLCLSISEQL
ncbi:MAG: formylglycine-generating enzyme family protein [Muribaculaceae bacterium]